MIVAKIELWLRGDERRAKGLGRIEIVNNLKGDRKIGEYDVAAKALEKLDKRQAQQRRKG